MNPIRLRFLEDKIDFLEGIAIVRGLDMITFSQRYSYVSYIPLDYDFSKV